MNLAAEVIELVPEMKAWRRHLHAHPETAFEEKSTSAFVAEKLRSFGLEVHTGLAGTGVVAVLRGSDNSAIGLRADMDALHILERSGVPHSSLHQGKMHACGHDLHMAAIVGTAAVMAHSKSSWHGTLMLIGQPAEETGAGARAMLADGLFTRFPKPDYALAIHDDASSYIIFGACTPR